MEKGIIDELVKKYGIDLGKLEKEQKELAKSITLKDAFDFTLSERIAAVETVIIQNKIIAAAIVFDKSNEIIEQAYFLDKLNFPYIHGFRAYRELPAMVSAIAKLKERPDLILVEAEGINHPRLGFASHLSLACGIPAVGVSDNLFDENSIKGEDVLANGKKVGKVIIGKFGSKPLYVCPGNSISINTSYDIVKNLILPPHKMPEPMHRVHKYIKEIRQELKL